MILDYVAILYTVEGPKQTTLQYYWHCYIRGRYSIATTQYNDVCASVCGTDLNCLPPSFV